MDKKEKWLGGDIETDIVPLEFDEGGKPIILRTLKFKFPPDIEDYPSEDDIAKQQIPIVETFLWKDELVLIEELRVTIDKDERVYYVHATCQPRQGATLYEKPTKLEDIIEPNDTRGDSI